MEDSIKTYLSTATVKTKLAPAVLALGVWLVAPTASAVQVNILDSQYTTYVFVQTNGFYSGVSGSTSGDFGIWSPGNSRTTVSATPFSDSMSIDGGSTPAAQANESMFGVSAYTDMREAFWTGWPGQNSTAGAESEIQFSPLMSGASAIDLNFLGTYNWYNSAGSVSLIDTTSDQTLWSYGWYLMAGTVPWDYALYPGSATLSLETDFNSGDTYTLTMWTQTFSDQDQEQTSIQLSGIGVASHPPIVVPEPATFAFIGLAALLLAFRCRPAWSRS